MKAIGFHAPGGPSVLTVLDLPTPQAGPGEVRVRVHAAAVNPADTLVRAGDVDLSAMPGPYVPGMDVAGVVDQAGGGSGFAVGDAVMAVVVPDRPHNGGYAQYVVVPAGQVTRAPRNVGPFEAATVPMNGLTALRALRVLEVGAGSAVAVTGSAGAFGGFFLQLGLAAGARVVADAGEADEALVRGLGAELVARRGPGWTAGVRELVPGGVGALADGALLGPAALDAIADDGAYAALRAPGERGTAPMPRPAPRGIAYRHVAFHENPDVPGGLRALADAVEAGRLTPRVAEVIGPADLARAHAAVEAGGVRGRFVVDLG
ncbi:NADP-dependent oxidoreductase [Streptomyces sp. NPDC049881]|uniref:NADP-dependent oxidoreductase n=1 Tax=Streptomyces sp. NPDC049881 TaxID=3155778 RepID=UPI0034270094